MNFHPVPFNAAMVKETLAGRKKQTRRILKNQPMMVVDGQSTMWDGSGSALQQQLERMGKGCPFGGVGDQLWVREAWRTVKESDHLAPRELNAGHRIWYEADAPHQPGAGRFRPGMFMPRIFSRISLEIQGVRLERLQDITDEDAWEEGINASEALSMGCTIDAARAAYSALWEGIYGPGSWDANPWVWVIGFSPIKTCATSAPANI